MSSNVPMTESQKAAVKIRGKDVLVSASAGAGKTFVLIERIITRLLDPNDPTFSLSSILVATFTRNATAELKARIAQALNEALQKDPQNERLSRELLLLGSAQISTIDSFLQKIVRDHFDTLGIPRAFRIISDEEEYPIAERVMQETLEAFYRKEAISEHDTLFALLDGNRFAEAIGALIDHKDEGALRKALIDFKEPFSYHPEGIELLKQSAEELRREAELPYFETRAGSALKRYTKDWIASARPKSKKLASFCDDLEAVLDQGYSAVFPLLKIEKVLEKGVKTTTADLQKLYSSLEVNIREEKLKSAEFAELLYRFYTEYEKRLMEEKKARGVLTFGDITTLAYGLLKPQENGEQSSLARALSERYTEIYIDEYQDVNRVQDEIFRLIGEGKRLMVGDIKQSIYRFRGGDPQVFADYRKKMPLYGTPEAENVPGNSIFMKENFRCNSNIIDTANDVCSELFQRAECAWNYDPDKDNLVFQKPRDYLDEENKIRQEEKQVQIHLLPNAAGKIKPEHIFVADEIERLSNDETEIKDNGRKIKAGDIVILVRTNTQAKFFAKALMARNIKANVQADSEKDIDPELTLLLNLLSVIDNPYKDLPLLETLQSPFVGFSLKEVSRIRNACDKSDSLYEALESYGKDDALGIRIKKALAFLEEQRENARTLSVDRFLRRLYETPAFVWMKQSDIPIYLYSMARQYAANSYVGLFEFLRYFEKLRDNGKLPANEFHKENDAVLITTIHKSKGQQYPVLFVTSLGSYFNDDELNNPIFYSQELGFSAKFFNKALLTHRSTADCEVEKMLLKEKSREESIRLLYVAMTRAKERLYLTGSPVGNATMESYDKDVEMMRSGKRQTILGATSFMPWVLSFLKDEEGLPYRIVRHPAPEVDPTAEELSEDDTPMPHTEDKPEVEESNEGSETESTDENSVTIPELSILHRLPSKVAASKVSPDLLDKILAEDKDEAIGKRLELLISASSFEGFLAKSREPNAADVGSATHAFLEFCDFSALKTKGVKDEAERLVTMGFLPKESLSLIAFDLLEQFLKSPLFEMIGSAKEILREQQFARLLPMKELTQNPQLKAELEGEEIFVQGSIDLLLSTETGWILVDYKTDRVQKGESFDAFRARMLASHGSQLKTYAQAVEELFDALPERIYLYSLPLGRLIEFSMSELPE